MNSLNDYDNTINYLTKYTYDNFKDNYVCTSVKENIWWKFHQHKWIIADNETLVIELSEKLTTNLLKLASQDLVEAQERKGSERDNLIVRATQLCKTIKKLKYLLFKDSLLSICSNQFYDSNFYQKLDENTELLCFNNGVYDLKNKCFRSGNPKDYISLSVGYDYKEYLLNDITIKEINTFFSQIQCDEHMKKYILMHIASCLNGNTKLPFMIWPGTGSNGKSTTLDLIRRTFGDYFGILPITAFTNPDILLDNENSEFDDKKGKRFLAVDEPNYNDIINMNLLKQLTGQDWIIGLSSNGLSSKGEAVMYKPQFNLVLACNHMPSILSHDDDGVWRRLNVSSWESEFVDDPLPHQFMKDPSITEKLNKWRQAFMWLLLNVYYPEYSCHGLELPAKTKYLTDQYIEENKRFSKNFVKENNYELNL